MSDFTANRKKDLDLVVCTPGSGAPTGKAASEFAGLVDSYGIMLSREEGARLREMPTMHRVAVGTVHIALEAKATMTAHIKALPRLHDELNSSHMAVHGSSDMAIAVGFTLVNAASDFVSSDMNKYNLSVREPEYSYNPQPRSTERTIEKIRQIPRRTQLGVAGFDAVGIVVIKMKNDGSPVELGTEAPAPDTKDIFHYDHMIRRIQSLYEGRFGNLLD
ncbi:MAG: hypothetical protein AAFM91_17640 [Pseudomonadota bacterium]